MEKLGKRKRKVQLIVLICSLSYKAVEDFMMVDKISELGFRLVYAERNETKWFHELEIVRQFFMYSPLTRSDHMEIQE